MNRRRSRARRQAAGPLAQEVRLRVEELKDERRQALVQLQKDMQPAEQALLEKRAEAQAALDRHRAVYRTRRAEIQRDYRAELEAIRRAAYSDIVVTGTVPT